MLAISINRDTTVDEQERQSSQFEADNSSEGQG
jgi:hypothetical protein